MDIQKNRRMIKELKKDFMLNELNYIRSKVENIWYVHQTGMVDMSIAI